MQTPKTNSAASVNNPTAHESNLTSGRGVKTLTHELLVTSVWTAMGTAALVSIHHCYRKQRQHDASVQDYVTGIRSQLPPMASASKRRLTRFQYACRQATTAWQRAYDTDSLADNGNGSDNSVVNNDVIGVSAIQSIIIAPRPVCWVSGVAAMPKNNAMPQAKNAKKAKDDNSVNEFGVVGIDADRQIVWQATMPERVHDIVVQPTNIQKEYSHNKHSPNKYSHNNDKTQSRDIVVMGRRPSEKFWVLEAASGQVQAAINASDNRHFYGHACYSLDGKWLYVTENDTISLEGKIGLYDANLGYKKIAEFDSHGIGPHELIMHPDGKTLIIANGGIKTEQASREELNLDTMRPSLVYLDRYDGTLLEQIIPEHNQMSVRHLALHDNGTVMIGIQFQGDKHINVPLVLTHQRGERAFRPLTMPNNQWQRFHQYIASVAVDSEHNQLCVTTPIGGCAATFDLNTYALIETVSLPDCAGAAVICKTSYNNETSGFIVSDGQGQLTTLSVRNMSTTSSNLSNDKGRIQVDSLQHSMSFDNHLQALL
ncbi:DUF1513 domain-containing protein [Psychrobacter sp. B38]|uniref:DUF1513 domain-containing protein n=1 Tax=Psychrobacter sp. B38 TaxID=3143538 RepID=UPI00320DFBA8